MIMCENKKANSGKEEWYNGFEGESVSCSVVSDSLQPRGL